MKSKFNIKSIIIISIISILCFIYFIPCFAANTAKVSVETANIRKTADANSTILDQASKGQQVEIIEKTGEWYKIKFNGIVGYLRQDLLEVSENVKQETEIKKEEPVSTPTPTAVAEQTNTIQQEEIDKTNTPTPEPTQITQTEKTEESTLYICKENTKLKIMPLILGKDIKEIEKNSTVSVLEINNKWALVESGTSRGWVLVSNIEKATNTEIKPEETVETPQETENKNNETPATNTQEAEKTQESKMYVNSEIVNLRATESTSSESLAKLEKGTEVTVTSTNNGWSKVKVNGKEGYISSSLLATKKPESVTSRSLEEARQEQKANEQSAKDIAEEITKQKEEESKNTQTATNTTPASTSNKGSEVCSYAKQYLKCSYVYGGTSPSGFDCSGFTQYVYKHFGISLNRTAEAQASNGTAVSKSNLKAGDLVIFTSHVGIYLGDGTFIHAANQKKGVTITSMSDSYYVKNYITARRIFN